MRHRHDPITRHRYRLLQDHEGNPNWPDSSGFGPDRWEQDPRGRPSTTASNHTRREDEIPWDAVEFRKTRTQTEMRQIDKVRLTGFDKLIKTQPTSIVGELIDEPAVIHEDGIPKLGYFFVPASLLKDIRHVVKNTKPQKSSRTNGLPTQSTVYGVM